MKMILIFFYLVPFLGKSQNSHTETTTYQYDNLNRLIQVDFSDGTTYNYVYDNLGNRIQLDVTLSSNPIGLKEELLKGTITVYPNPTTGNISINLPETMNAERVLIKVLDMNGKYVIEKEITLEEHTLQLQTNSLNSGVYLLKVSDGGSNDWSQLFIRK